MLCAPPFYRPSQGQPPTGRYALLRLAFYFRPRPGRPLRRLFIFYRRYFINPIRAEINKSNRCDAEGYTVSASAPVLAMCRKLVEVGYDPATPLHAYRGDTLCLKVRSIGEGAELECQEGGDFRLREPRPCVPREGPLPLPSQPSPAMQEAA